MASLGPPLPEHALEHVLAARLKTTETGERYVISDQNRAQVAVVMAVHAASALELETLYIILPDRRRVMRRRSTGNEPEGPAKSASNGAENLPDRPPDDLRAATCLKARSQLSPALRGSTDH